MGDKWIEEWKFFLDNSARYIFYGNEYSNYSLNEYKNIILHRIMKNIFRKNEIYTYYEGTCSTCNWRRRFMICAIRHKSFFQKEIYKRRWFSIPFRQIMTSVSNDAIIQTQTRYQITLIRSLRFDLVYTLDTAIW